MTRRIAVTGASGFIGRALEPAVARLGLVRGLFRAPSPASEQWQVRGHEVVFGSLDDAAALAELVSGADVVYHCAARMDKGDPAASHAVNVTGTERLARAARVAEVGRLVYVSSVSVYASSRLADPTVTEDVAPRHLDRLNPYSATKHAGELVVQRLAEQGEGPPWTIIRPTNVYGPGAKSWVLDWINRLQRLPVVLGGDIPIDLVHVDDVVAAMVLAGDTPAAEGELFHVGGETVMLGEYAVRLGAAVGIRVRRLPGPADALLRHLLDRAYVLVKGSEKSMSLTRVMHYPHAKAGRLLGYAPRVTLEAGLTELADWYHREYLPTMNR